MLSYVRWDGPAPTTARNKGEHEKLDGSNTSNETTTNNQQTTQRNSKGRPRTRLTLPNQTNNKTAQQDHSQSIFPQPTTASHFSGFGRLPVQIWGPGFARAPRLIIFLVSLTLTYLKTFWGVKEPLKSILNSIVSREVARTSFHCLVDAVPCYNMRNTNLHSGRVA